MGGPPRPSLELFDTCPNLSYNLTKMNQRKALLFFPILAALLALALLHAAARAQAGSIGPAGTIDTPQTTPAAPSQDPPAPGIPAGYPLMSAADWQDFNDFITSMPATLTLPATIRVAVTGDWRCDVDAPYTVTVVNFVDYLQHVLPNEWPYYYRDESLRAGAMATKMFAWYWVARGGWRPAEFDVWDSTCSQWYAPQNPTRPSTDRAIAYTWDWRLATAAGEIFPTYYRADSDSCPLGTCMSQEGSNELANKDYTWDEILRYYYSERSPQLIYPRTFPAGWALQFNGLPGDSGENRLLIPLDDPTTDEPGPPVDVGAQDFTIEWWLRASPSAYPTTSLTLTCGVGQDWTLGSILLDRWLPEPNPGYGVSLHAGRLLVGVTGQPLSGSQTISDSLTLCGNAVVVDDRWHHIAVQRRAVDGQLWLYVDGRLDASAGGPDGDISYPDALTPTLPGTPYLAVGAWRHDAVSQTSAAPPDLFYRGWLDELRFSSTLRYTQPFSLPNAVFTPDAATLALYHFDEALGNTIHDTSAAPGGPSHAQRLYGGSVNGPEWWPSDLYPRYTHRIALPLILKDLP